MSNQQLPITTRKKKQKLLTCQTSRLDHSASILQQIIPRGLETSYFDKETLLSFFTALGSSVTVVQSLDVLLTKGSKVGTAKPFVKDGKVGGGSLDVLWRILREEDLAKVTLQ